MCATKRMQVRGQLQKPVLSSQCAVPRDRTQFTTISGKYPIPAEPSQQPKGFSINVNEFGFRWFLGGDHLH